MDLGLVARLLRQVDPDLGQLGIRISLPDEDSDHRQTAAPPDLEPTIYRFIFKHSWRSQIAVLLLTLTSFPFLYVSLDLPKTIVNHAIRADAKFPQSVFGFEFERVPYLMLLCGAFLATVLVNGGFKYVINVYQGVVGERMLRRLRFELFSRVLRFPLPHFRHISSGEIVQMINAEVEPLGGFIAEAFALPMFQGGTLLTIHHTAMGLIPADHREGVGEGWEHAIQRIREIARQRTRR